MSAVQKNTQKTVHVFKKLVRLFRILFKKLFA
jgi:hypothetical protein